MPDTSAPGSTSATANPSRFATDIVLVTGAAGALGRATVQRFLAEGARVAAVDLHLNAVQTMFADIGAGQAVDTGQVLACNGDLTNPEACAQVLGQVCNWAGTPSVLVNIAGGFAMGEPVHRTDDTTWNQLFDLNVTTLRRMVTAVVPAMIAQGHGRVVNIGAHGALRGGGQMGAYTAAKATVIRLTEAMADELKGQGINVNSVLPGVIDTPANRQAMPDADPSQWVPTADLAAAIAFLASADARSIHGAALSVTGLS